MVSGKVERQGLTQDEGAKQPSKFRDPREERVSTRLPDFASSTTTLASSAATPVNRQAGEGNVESEWTVVGRGDDRDKHPEKMQARRLPALTKTERGQ